MTAFHHGSDPFYSYNSHKLNPSNKKVIALGVGLAVGALGTFYLLRRRSKHFNMESLNEQQTDLLTRFQNLTGVDDLSLSIRYLNAANWNIEVAVNEYLNRGSRNDITTSTSQSRNVNNSWYGSLSNFFSYLIPAPAADEDPVTAANKFLTEFENSYGTIHPTMLTTSFQQACNAAKSDYKFLIVYIHSPLHQNTPSFCRNTLCSPTLVDFLNENFLFWGAAVNKQEGFKVSNLLSASTFPFLAVLCTINLNGSSTTMLDRIEGVTSVEDFLSRLAVVLENYGPVLINAKLDAEERNINQRIREEQDEEFERSLREDQEKARKISEEQEQIRLEEERKKREELEEQKLQQDREKRKQMQAKRVPQEPATNEPGATSLVIRLTDGSRLQRRFKSSDKLQAVFDFVASQPTFEIEEFELVMSFPRTVFSDPNQTLQDAGLVPQAALFVQEK